MIDRKGSAIVLSILAIAVISMAGITIVRSHRRMNFRQSAVQARCQGRLIAQGLIHREIAFRRLTPTGLNVPIDPSLGDFDRFENAQCISSNVDVANQTMDASVVLYPGGPPAIVRQGLSISN